MTISMSGHEQGGQGGQGGTTAEVNRGGTTAGGQAGRTLTGRSAAFRLAQQLASEIAREGRRPGRYEIAITAQIWPGDTETELLVADVVYTWRWCEPDPPDVPEVTAAAQG